MCGGVHGSIYVALVQRFSLCDRQMVGERSKLEIRDTKHIRTRAFKCTLRKPYISCACALS